MKGLSRFKKDNRRKNNQIFNIVIIFLMLFSNLPAFTVDALESDSLSENSFHLAFDNDLVSYDDDEFKITTDISEESDTEKEYQLTAYEINQDYLKYEEYKNRAVALLGDEDVSLKLYGISIVSDNEKFIPESETVFNIEKVKESESTIYDDTKVLVLYSEDKVISGDAFSIDFSENDDNPVLVLSNCKKTIEQTEIQDTPDEVDEDEGDLKISAVFSEETDHLHNDLLSVSEISKDDDKYSQYVNEDDCIAEGYYVDYLKLFDLTIDKEENDEEDDEILEESDEPSIKVELVFTGDYFDIDLENLKIICFTADGKTLLSPDIEETDDGLFINFDVEEAVVFGLVEAKREITLTYSEDDYLITATFNGDSGISANAQLKVSEIIEADDEYDDLVNRSSESLGEDPENIAVVKAFDIALINPETGEEYQPDNNVRISIELLEDNINDYSALDVVHISDSEEETQVLDSSINGDALEFETDGFSVYVIVQTVLKQTLTASDGKEYLVAVSFNETSGIPANAQLHVSEIKDGEQDYDEYVRKTAAALGSKKENLSIARVFDITLIDPETGEEYQPNKDVQVSIELLDENLSNYQDLNVIHIHGEETEVIDSTVYNNAVEFETDGFSIYVLGDVYTYTYIFYASDTDVTEIVTDEGFKVENWASVYDQVSVQTENGSVSSQTVKSGELPVIPQYVTRNGKNFAGWFEGTYSGSDVLLGKEPYVFDNIEITENKTVILFARYSSFINVVFHDQYNSSLDDYPVTNTRRGEMINGTASVKISDVSATYSGNEELAFYGWSETPVRTPGEKAELIAVDNEGCISITEQKHLYPVFQSIHWLSFYSGPEHSGASYVPTAYVYDEDGKEGPLTVPTYANHRFVGWYVGMIQDGTIIYSSQITYSDGSFVPGIEGDGYKLHAGRLVLTKDTILYAKWEDNTTADYRIAVWTQKPTDSAGIGDDEKTYDFYSSDKENGTSGTEVSVPSSYQNLPISNYQYSRCDDAKQINSDGSTVLNVYYDLDSFHTSGENHLLTYKDSVASGSSDDLPNRVFYSYNDDISSFTPSSGRKGYSFVGWYYDEDCVIPAVLDKMPDRDVTVYAGWKSIKYRVIIDPNYGAFPDGSTGSMWFNNRVDEDPVQEYLDVSRDYVESSSGTYFYVKHDLAYYGGNAPDGVPRNEAFYTTEQSQATEDTTFEYSPGIYTYAGWYEVHDDGTETLYDFSHHTDHNTTIKLHWKKTGIYCVQYDAGSGVFSGNQDTNDYADQSGVLINVSAKAPSGKVFNGWRIRGDKTGHVYRTGQNFILSSEFASIVNGKNTVYLDAVYAIAETAKIIYDANGGVLEQSLDDVDFGSPVSDAAPTPILSINGQKATISNLINNSEFRLSDGTGFYRENMTLIGWSENKDYVTGDTLYDCNEEYGVDSKEPITLYAVWQVKATYHLNTDSATATWNGKWEGYDYNSTDDTYSKNVPLGNKAPEPLDTPKDTHGKLFRYWSEDRDGSEAYDFSEPISNNLDLYACWSEEISVTVHAVDASSKTIEEKTSTDGWTVMNISLGSEPVELTGNSHVTVPAGSDYEFAFAAFSDNIDSISENNSVVDVYYNTTEKELYVTYEDGKKAPLGDDDIYFVYYKKKALSIDYKSMGFDGALGAVNVDSDAPISTGDALLGSYQMSNHITSPLGWVQSSAYTYYSFAVGKADAQNASDLIEITDASSSDGSLPTLDIRNSWKGFQYSTDGEKWVNCDYNPVLYVIYYTQQPFIVTVREQTKGSSDVINEVFKYRFVIKQTTTDNTDPDNPVITTTTLFDNVDNEYVLSNGEEQSAILFYSKTGDVEVTQTITVTQTNKDGFSTTVKENDAEAVSSNSWTYTNSSTVSSPVVTFTNTQANKFVEVHVARIDTVNKTIVSDDILRSSDNSFVIVPGESKSFLTELPSADLFIGDTSVYAFGAIIYGSENSSQIITPKSMNVSSIDFREGNNNIYDLILKDEDGNDLGGLENNKIYYLYYPMPQIKYVKNSGGTLSDIFGSSDGTVPDYSKITYDFSPITMNGATVVQNQKITLPLSGLKITQKTENNSFRMPSILDDGVYARYLSYAKLGAGEADKTNISDIRYTDSLTMYIRINNNALEWSFNEEEWNDFGNTPTIYAIYEERGYDLLIQKTVPIDVGSNPSFAIKITSPAITKNSYAIEGYKDPTIEADPLTGTIAFDVVDGTSYKIKGLGQGNYTVSETGSENYILTAKCGPLYGESEDIQVVDRKISITLDRELKLDLINTSKAICKITVNEIEHPFYKLQDAMEYIKDNLPSASPIYVQMLTDYVIPSSDVPVVPTGYNVVLNTAPTSGGEYNFDGGSTGDKVGATITRDTSYTSGPIISNRGTLTLENLTLDGNNVETDSAMIVSAGKINVNVGTVLQNGNNSSGNGGAIYSSSGAISIEGGTFRNNTAEYGGAIWTEGSGISISGTELNNAVFANNSAVDGGAIYYNSNGQISISEYTAFNQNNASGNGGAIYTKAGIIEMSEGNMTGNKASQKGGAIYTKDGAVNMSGGSIKNNEAINGSAIFVDEGTASFSNGIIEQNIASNGGAVGVGDLVDGDTIDPNDSAARLYFSGSIRIVNNRMGDTISNVYLDKDTDAIINASGLNIEDTETGIVGAEIGIYVPGDMDADLFKNRGVPGARFGIFSSASGISGFKNDRLPGTTVTADDVTRRLVWGKSIQVQVRYLEKYNSSFPKKQNNVWNGNKKYPTGDNMWLDYYLPANNNSTSSIADDLRAKYSLNLSNTDVFAYAFVDDGSENISFDNYVTDVNWNNDSNSWKFVKRDGQEVGADKLVVYFSKSAFINIENNTNFVLNISDLTILGYPAINSDTQTGYGYVHSVNGSIQSNLKPIKQSDLSLAVGKSVKLLFPGADASVYSLNGGFAVGDDPNSIKVTQTGVSSVVVLEGDNRKAFSLGSGKTKAGDTVDVIFGGQKPICKIVTATAVDGVSDGDMVAVDNPDEDGVAYIFSSLNQALNFIVKYHEQGKLSNTATIEMLIDYLIPGSDVLSIPDGYNITLTTAYGNTATDYNYAENSGTSQNPVRAKISRDPYNQASFITVPEGKNTTTLNIKDLDFDGRSLSGGSDGGAIKTKDCAVTIVNADFLNFISGNGGAIFIEYGDKITITGKTSHYYAFDESYDSEKATLYIKNANFANCESKSTTGRCGGGGVWTNAKYFTMEGGSFTKCTAGDQGGALFHRIDNNTYEKVKDQPDKQVFHAFPYTYSSVTSITGVNIIGCEAGAAGGIESDAHSVTLKNCKIESCVAKARNGGGVNVYSIQNTESIVDPEDPDNPSSLYVEECSFVNNTASIKATDGGGGLRSTAVNTIVKGSTFTGNSTKNGGGMAITFAGAKEITISDGCVIKNNNASGSGGGIYVKGTGAALKISNCTVDGNTASSQGGGIYTASAMTLTKNSEIRNNHLTSSNKENAAGVYINNKTLTIGTTGETDSSSITNNTVSGGIASNLRMWSGNNANSVYVLGDLSGTVGVINHGNIGTQFGTSAIERPAGFGDPNDDNPDYWPTFAADDNTTYGIVNRADETGMTIIWAGPPVCKITDAEGNLLYLDPDCNYPATFDVLEGGTDGSWTSAFSTLRNGAAGRTLYRIDGTEYPKNNKAYPYYVKMLVENYELNTSINTTSDKNRTIILTTAESGTGRFDYRGTEGTTCTIIRSGSKFTNSMILAKCNMTLTNITIDGGSENGLVANPSNNPNNDNKGGLVNILSTSGITFKLAENGVLQNSHCKKEGGAVGVNWSDFELCGGTIQNCTSDVNGGAVYMFSRKQSNPDRGYLRFTSGNIINCSAENGGAVYVNTGVFTMSAVSIRECKATTNGGGICYMADGREPSKSFTIDSGTISNCEAINGSGGGIYINDGKELNMNGGFIIGNKAKVSGGGIAIGGSNAKIYFSKTPWISGNTCDSSVADGKVCNVELDQDNIDIINAKGIWNGAKIGIYVPGEDNGEGASTSLYDKHGGLADRFGTFDSVSDASYLYGFVNDRNGLKGGLKSGEDPSSYKGIHWIEIFSLEINKEVKSYLDSVQDEFAFKVTLTGIASDGTASDEINSGDDLEKYAGLYFINGVATEKVVKEGDTVKKVPLKLKDGESITAERLPAGLNYMVEELLTDGQKAKYSATPDEVIRGYIGENSGNSSVSNRYLSKATFTNIQPRCKITMNNNSTLLYYKTTIEYKRNDNGIIKKISYDKYLPAVYMELEEAFKTVNNGNPRLYFNTGDRFYSYEDSYYQIEMLTNYTMKEAVAVNNGKTIRLKTADKNASRFAYQGLSNAVVRRGDKVNDVSLLTANGSLEIQDITINGQNLSISADGGIVFVPANGTLNMYPGAVLCNSITTGSGGAVYVSSSGVMTMTGGTINYNKVSGSGKGAGIYLEEDSKLYVSGDIYFGGSGVYNDGSLSVNTGNIQAGRTRQDIYIAGYEAEDGAVNAKSLVIAGNITQGKGTIWVWAEKTPHYKTLQQFAEVKHDVTVNEKTCNVFRNSRDDAITENDTGNYLYGSLEGEVEKKVYWNGITGKREVILRKINASYDSLNGAEFTICRNEINPDNPYKVKDSNGDLVELKGIRTTSIKEGIIWVGILPYGTYYLIETTAPAGYTCKTYKLIIDDLGDHISEVSS